MFATIALCTYLFLPGLTNVYVSTATLHRSYQFSCGYRLSSLFAVNFMIIINIIMKKFVKIKAGN